MRWTRMVFLLAIGALIAACAGVVRPPPALVPTGPPAGFPEESYRRAAERGEPVFSIDPERSQIVIYVYRGGSLARLGHDHAIASSKIHGYVWLPDAAAGAKADLYVPLAAFTVDEPALRAQAGFDTQPSPQDIEGTRQNMLDKVLEATAYPFVTVHLTHEPSEQALNAEVSLHGVTRSMRFPVAMDTSVADTLTASGRFFVNQTDFGMTPYSVLGGALRVQDRVDVRFQIHASRVPAGPSSTTPR